MASGPFHCVDCGIYFESDKSLEVHLQYHKENLINMWMSSDDRPREVGQPETSPTQSDLSQMALAGTDTKPIMSSAVSNSGASSFNTPSPMQYDFKMSPSMQSPQGRLVPPGPPSGHSASVSFPHSAPGFYADCNQQHDQLQLSNYCYPSQFMNGIEDQFYGRQGATTPRFHPYMGRSPVPTPSPGGNQIEVKEEIKEEQTDHAAEILDLDSQKVLGKMNNHLHSTGALPPMWRPHEQYSSLNSGGMVLNTMGNIASVTQTSPYGSTHISPPQQSPILTNMNTSPAAYSSSSSALSSFNPQGYPSVPSVDNSQAPILGLPSSPRETAPAAEFASNVKRPKSFKCEDCNKWFTSQGHLKRHYNTTLHKNMTKLHVNGNGSSTPDSSRPSIMSPGAKSEASTTSSHEEESNLSTSDALETPPPPSGYQPAGSAFQPPSSLSGFQAQGHMIGSTASSMPTGLPPNLPQYSQASGYAESSAPTVYHGHFSTNPSMYGSQPPGSVGLNFYPSTNFNHFTLQGGHQGPGFHSMNDFPGQTAIDSLNNFKLDQERPLSQNRGGTEMTNAISPDTTGGDTGSEASMESGESNPGGDASFKCGDCSKTFNRMCYLTQHRSTYHEGEKPFKCSTCGKRFLDEITFTDHQSKHAGEKPYKCEVCPKQFNHKTDLRRHMCLHTGEKPFSCEQCGKGFIRKDHMLKHFQTHRKKAMAAAGSQVTQHAPAGVSLSHPGPFTTHQGHLTHTPHPGMPHPSHVAPRSHPPHVVAPPVY